VPGQGFVRAVRIRQEQGEAKSQHHEDCLGLHLVSRLGGLDLSTLGGLPWSTHRTALVYYTWGSEHPSS
jgi:hypothetical protein